MGSRAMTPTERFIEGNMSLEYYHNLEAQLRYERERVVHRQRHPLVSREVIAERDANQRAKEISAEAKKELDALLGPS